MLSLHDDLTPNSDCRYALARRRDQRDAAVPAGRLDVEFLLKVQADRFSVGHSYHPNTVDVLRVVLGIVGRSYIARRVVGIQLNKASTCCRDTTAKVKPSGLLKLCNLESSERISSEGPAPWQPWLCLRSTSRTSSASLVLFDVFTCFPLVLGGKPLHTEYRCSFFL